MSLRIPLSVSRLAAVLATVLTATLLVVATAVPASATAWPTVRQGDRGVDVVTVQRLLTQRGYPLTTDGAFGPQTRNQVVSFQIASGLPSDGVVGTATWSALLIPVSRGARGQAVRAVQEQLRALGYSITVDGVFGSRTESIVRTFQSASGVFVSGVVDGDTWRELTARSPG